MTDKKNDKKKKSLIDVLKKKADVDYQEQINKDSKEVLKEISKEKKSSSTIKIATPEKKLKQIKGESLLPVIPIREGVLFPSTESVLTFGRKLSLNAIKLAKKKNTPVVLLTQKKSSTNLPKPGDLYSVGTLAVIEKTLSADNNVSALVRGVSRVKIVSYQKKYPVIVAKVKKIDDILNKSDKLDALSSHLQKKFKQLVQMGKPVEFLNFMKLMGGANEGELTDQIASTLNISSKKKQEVLEIIDVKKRMEKVTFHLNHEAKILEIEKDVVFKTQKAFDKNMRENVLRARMHTIQKELGEIEDGNELGDDYSKKLKKITLPTDVENKVKKEISRLKNMSINNPESGYIRSWLNIFFDLPWGKRSRNQVDLHKASKILDQDHYGLEEVKDRVLENIAVLQMHEQKKKNKKTKMPTILCFVGPPGVGKTSIGKSIAKALGRKFAKVSLGGIKDEAEIRGHRKTYIGAMTGRIIKGIIQSKSSNPVFILDEIDKIGSNFRGDPASALLEVLDPEQNEFFEDHFLDVPFDLSEVFFITTANSLDTIPHALKDRLEIIRFSGYTWDEKFNIAKKYLISKTSKANALTARQITIPNSTINTITHRYTHEAGVRELERMLNKIMRKTARKILEDSKTKKIAVNEKILKKFLGPEKYDITFTEKEDKSGVVTGLAWTQLGGDILFIEAAQTPGKGKIQLTGQLGDVMKESAQAAYTYIKANAKKFNINVKNFANTNIHIHVPEGAIPKDGPSAGVTMATAIYSLLTKKKVYRKTAMTGEITLRGKILRIGGLKEKLVAAQLAGCKTIIIPKENERDLIKIPEHVKKGLVFKPVSELQQVLKLATHE